MGEESISKDVKILNDATQELLNYIDLIKVKYNIGSNHIERSKLIIGSTVKGIIGISGVGRLGVKELKDLEFSIIELAQGKKEFLLLIRDSSGIGLVDVATGKIYRYGG
jgi:hypothetical protein